MTTLIADFSKTLTSSDKPTTWSVLSLSGILGESYSKKRNALFDENHKYECAGDIKKTHNWFADHLKLMIDSGLTQNHINILVRDERYFEPRLGLRSMIDFCNTHKIRIIVITSGIKNFVEAFLESLDIDCSNITIVGNTLLSNNLGYFSGYEDESVFCPLESKAQFEKNLNINKEESVFLLGDKPEDLEMYKGCYTSIGFNKNSQGFDINFGKDGSLNDVISEINKCLQYFNEDHGIFNKTKKKI